MPRARLRMIDKAHIKNHAPLILGVILAGNRVEFMRYNP